MNIQSILHLIPKATYYNTKEEIVKEGLKNHRELFNSDRELYTYLLYFNNSTYYSKSVIIEELLKNSLHKPENEKLMKEDSKLLDIESALIHNALFNENITRGIKMLLSLKHSRINNARTTNVILDFIFNRGNTDFIAIKYKRKIKDLIIHAYGLPTVYSILNREKKGLSKFKSTVGAFNNPFALEVFDFVFDVDKEYSSPYLKEYTRVRNLFKNGQRVELSKEIPLPIEVLTGFNNFFKTNLDILSLISHANVSDKQKIQMQNTVKRHSNNQVEIVIDLNKYSLMELCKYLYSKTDITKDEINECIEVIESKALEIRKSIENNFLTDIDKTAIIVDLSDSHFGSDETKLHPMFKNLSLAQVFQNEQENNIFYVGGTVNDKVLVEPSGDTNLTKPLLEAAKSGFKDIIVLSDGFENVYSFDKALKQLKRIGYNLNVTHFNPVFSPRNFSFKSITDEAVAIPFTDVSDLEDMMLFYQLNTDREVFKKIMRKKIETELLK